MIMVAHLPKQEPEARIFEIQKWLPLVSFFFKLKLARQDKNISDEK